jgi:hypothetical protein
MKTVQDTVRSARDCGAAGDLQAAAKRFRCIRCDANEARLTVLPPV